MITIGKLAPPDRADWEVLFRGYNAFYQVGHPQSMYDRAWEEFQADERMHALGAWVDGSLAGIVHFLVHPRTTGSDVCYLEDLYTDASHRGQGVGRSLILAVRDWRRQLSARPFDGPSGARPTHQPRPTNPRRPGPPRGR